ncbi:MAG: ABC transporter permease subunit [Bacteroidota bacterium]
MLQYALRRVLLAIPTLLIVSLCTFWLGQCAPRDPKLEFVENGPTGGSYKQQLNSIIAEAIKQKLYKPAFYFSFSAAAFPDTLYKVLPLSRRNRLIKLTAQTGNWDAQIRFEAAVSKTIDAVLTIPDSLPQKRILLSALSNLTGVTRFDTLNRLFARMDQAAQTMPDQMQRIATLRAGVQEILTVKQPEKLWIPAFYWFGINNRYHDWLFGFLTGDLGITNSMKLPVWQEIKSSLWSSLTITVLAILLAYMAAIPLGIFLGQQQNKGADRWLRRLLMFIYAVPLFIVGALLTTLFVSRGAIFPLIDRFYIPPLQGSGQYALVWIFENMPVMLLPILTMTLHALAILALQMRGGILNVIGQDFIRTARAKGADEETVYWRHAYGNALFPLIATFPGLFPGVFAGSIVVERLFNYYGIGSKTMEAINTSDYPLIFIIVMLVAVIIVVSNLIADILYAWADPRIRYTKK